jgi:hypothetical protein
VVALLIFLLTCYGTTNILVSGKIFAGPRKFLQNLPGKLGKVLGYLSHCVMCSGFYVGILWILVGLHIPQVSNNTVELLTAGPISSGFCWAMRVLMAKLGEDSL